MLLMTAGVMLSGCSQRNDSQQEPTKPRAQVHNKNPPKNFWMKGLNIKRLDGGLVRFQMAAETIIHRHRVTPLVYYENFDEVLVEGLKVRAPLEGQDPASPRHPPSQAGRGRKPAGARTLSCRNAPIFSTRTDCLADGRDPVRLPLHDMVRAFKGINHSWRDEDQSGANSRRAHDILSRVMIDRADLALGDVPTPITLRSDRAKLGTDLAVIAFEGHVVIQSARCRLTAPMVLGSRRLDGFLFPSGLQENGKTIRGTVYVTLFTDGACRRSRTGPRLVYRDIIEEQEASLLATLTKSMPPWAGFLLGAGLQTLARPEQDPPVPLEDIHP